MEIISQNNYGDRIGFGTRLGAFIIDAIIICIIAFILGMMGLAGGGILGAATGAAVGNSAEGALGGGIVGAIMGFVAGAVIASFVYSLLEAFTGLTIGKILLGIRVKNQDGTVGNTGLYLKRWAIKNISTLCSVAALITSMDFLSSIGSLCGLIIFIGFFLALRDNKQTLHDQLAKTAVFRK